MYALLITEDKVENDARHPSYILTVPGVGYLFCDVDALVEIERDQVPAEYFRSFDIALRAARVYHNVVIAYIGQTDYADLAAEMADILLRLEGIRWAICMGAYQGELVLSVRTRGRRGGAGRLAQNMVENRVLRAGTGPWPEDTFH